MPTTAPSTAASPKLAPGAGRIEVTRADGASAVVGLAARAPLHLLVPRPRGLAAWAYAATFGGGLVAGDTVSLTVNVGPGARALLGTQASTKVYRSEGLAARQHLEARVDEGALLAVLPDPVVCFAGAVYAQRQRVELAPGASLLFVDGLGAGRATRSERWRFASYRSVTEVYAAGRLLAREALVLEDGPEGSIAQRLGRFDALAFVVLLGPLLEATARVIVAQLGDRRLELSDSHGGGTRPRRPEGQSPSGPHHPATHSSFPGRSAASGLSSVASGNVVNADKATGRLHKGAAVVPTRAEALLVSASPVAGGAVIRVAAERPEDIANFLRNLLETVPILLGDDPWARRG